MARRIAVEIVGDSASLEKAFKRSAASAQKFDKSVEKAGKGRRIFGGLGKAAAGLGGALGIGGLAGAARAAFDEMADAQKVSAQTAAALKSTHGAANVTAKQIDELAGSLGNLSGTDDEAIKSGENLLLTFTNIRNEAGKGNDVFSQATGTMLDMSTALGQSMKTSAIQLGKALNDPVKGIKALTRVGVTFTEGQQKQIKAMVKAGDTMGAQKLILGELNREFGGSAKAAGETLPGQLNKLKETMLNLGGSIAESLAPQITALVSQMADWFSKSQNQKTIMDTVKTVTDTLSTALGILKTAFQVLSTAVGGNKNAIKALIAAYAGFKVLQFASKITTLAGTFGVLTRKQKEVTTAEKGATTAAKGLRGSLAGKAGVAGAVVAAGFALSQLIRQIPGWDSAMRSFGGTIYNLASNLGLVNDQMKQFEGKAAPSQQLIGRLRGQARQLERGGLTPRQAADRIARQNPGVARHDIDVAAGVTARTSAITINGGLHLNGIQNPRQMEDALHKRAKRRPQPRR